MLAEFPVPGDNPAGGPQVAVARLVRELATRDVDVVVVAPDGFTGDTGAEGSAAAAFGAEAGVRSAL